MSSELLASGVDNLKGHLAGAFNVLTGSSGDYTDLGIGRKFGGAAAAYSLRDVGAMNGPVVRVRRDSDNSEQDFSALAVPFIPEWCNRQVIKPLDVKALQSDGRTGDFIIAKAAYSLRSLGDRQATVAATNDTVARADGKYVVQVRRNVDGTIKSFTADEVTDGTLVSFVNESFTSSLPLDVQGSAAAAYSLRNLSSTYSGAVVNVRRSSDDTTRDFTADSITNGSLVSFVNEEVLVNQTDASWTGWSDVGNASSSTSGGAITVTGATASESDGIRYNAFLPLTSNKYRFVFNVSALNLDGATSFQLKGNASNVVTSITSTGSYSVEHTVHSGGWGNFINFTLVGSPSSGASITIDSLQIYSIAGDGHVATWYDQSGNDNHATQGTAGSQPKIVSDGSLVSLGVDFTGGKFMPFTSISAKTITAANQLTDTTNFNYLVGRSSGDGGARTDSGNGLFMGQDTASSASADFNNAGGTTHVNSSQSSFLATNANVYFGTGTSGFAVTALGTAFEFSGVARSWRGKIAEVIIYTTDQSENRRAIEESIATNYSITLGSFSRDGMVRTWYDQSVTDQGGATGNAHHAIQATAANQPKVVSNGSLVTGGVVFDSGEFLEKGSLSVSSPLNTFVVSTPDTDHNGAILKLGTNTSQQYRTSTKLLLQYSETLFSDASTYTVGQQNLQSFQYVAGTSVGFFNGTQVISATATGETIDKFRLGNSSTGLDGKINEVILYNSDQTDNRGAFEANIASHFGITAIPTAADPPTVNGFVETWYDQSGNGKDAVQATSTNQPKIVESGVLVKETRSGVTTPAIKFTSDSGTPANGNFLETSSNYLTTSDSAITTCLVVPAQDDASNQKGILGKNNSNNRISIDHSGNNGYRFNIPASRVYVNSGQTIGDVDLYFNVVAGTSANTDDECFRNNTQLTNNTGTVPSVGADMNQIGARKGGTASAEGTDGNYQEVIIYTSDLRSDGANIRNNIINHYSLPQD